MVLYENRREQEQALLVSVDTGEFDAEASLQELYELTRSAGAEPFGSMLQKRPSPDTATCVGSGFLQEIVEMVRVHGLGLVIFDCELSPTQLRNLERAAGVRVIDRTMLILDIFAQRARSREGRLQVELAQLQYLLPRLSGQGTALSRLGGGIGTRGPGETKLETDRRHVRRRIAALQEKLREVEARRTRAMERRKKDGVTTVALVGYTNAGKSTLMNALTNAGVLAENKLFATLDPTARALRLPHGAEVMLVDTVGLVRRLPHHLVAAFRSTLEQAAQADLILNVCDASSGEAQLHFEVAKSLLLQLGCEAPVVPVLNKCDLVPGLEAFPMIGGGLRVSAITGEGLQQLLTEVERRLGLEPVRVELLLPFAKSGLAAKLREGGTVLREEYRPDGLWMEAALPPSLMAEAAPYRCADGRHTEQTD